MSRSAIRLAGALVASGLLAAALGGSVLAQSPAAPSGVPASPAAAGPRVVTLNIGAGKIDPATVEVVKGESVIFEAVNVSDTEVELIVGLKPEVDADAGDSLMEAEEIAPGETKRFERAYPFTGEGPYAYGDQIGDHYAAGAKGDIVLVDALTQ
jgi:uncharacterized cupredoxin-like copper-binding protein